MGIGWEGGGRSWGVGHRLQGGQCNSLRDNCSLESSPGGRIEVPGGGHGVSMPTGSWLCAPGALERGPD